MKDKPKRRVPRSVREREIVDAAVHVFSQRGYRAAVVDEIAELAGISKPMVYLYFTSKEGLFVACVRREARRLAETFREAAQRAGGSPELRLWAGLSAFFAFVAERRDSWVVLHRQAPEQSEAIAAELAEARRTVMAEVTALVASGISDSDGGDHLGEFEAEFVAHALVGAADAVTDWMERHPDSPPDGASLRLMNMVWIGMRDVLAGGTWAPQAP
ncbi:TetR/AcrR family transcriptional regulator [Streptomyces radicis]|uniref:TetR/AcrR family transcriptional regulator n=1 Tax=Streptomyces radicis TaxID=1750517 RepID=A0A3A9VUL4_9ACTN|nr:TetR/AcrR family transcriptional regulator [Streptomyces radicis]RKN03863.1 TetR/AcrR family transcriptional regulator [Streptomyces radicis]RKN13943.1 TetR/AcrR family transcriptional regulator [Streptomyces radicis]